jgi:hypothetical protein
MENDKSSQERVNKQLRREADVGRLSAFLRKLE